jgi:hypothetical protein
VGGFGRHVVSDAKTQASDEAGAAFFSERGDASEYVPRRRLVVELGARGGWGGRATTRDDVRRRTVDGER